eukprot:m.31573 g.31573  ORF g.31573 m.31573 type:complete len:59 (+) comp9710_c0_seq2:213-389(+)
MYFFSFLNRNIIMFNSFLLSLFNFPLYNRRSSGNDEFDFEEKEPSTCEWFFVPLVFSF